MWPCSPVTGARNVASCGAFYAPAIAPPRTGQLPVAPASEITTEALLERYKRHQKARIRPTTYERLGGILGTLQAHLPEQARAITKRTVAAA
jgi:hypothetical protein